MYYNVAFLCSSRIFIGSNSVALPVLLLLLPFRLAMRHIYWHRLTGPPAFLPGTTTLGRSSAPKIVGFSITEVSYKRGRAVQHNLPNVNIKWKHRGLKLNSPTSKTMSRIRIVTVEVQPFTDTSSALHLAWLGFGLFDSTTPLPLASGRMFTILSLQLSPSLRLAQRFYHILRKLTGSFLFELGRLA